MTEDIKLNWPKGYISSGKIVLSQQKCDAITMPQEFWNKLKELPVGGELVLAEQTIRIETKWEGDKLVECKGKLMDE